MIPYILRSMLLVNFTMVMFRIRVLICLMGIFFYILLPIDILPEAVFGIFGFMDDLFISIALLARVVLIFRRLIAEGGMHF